MQQISIAFGPGRPDAGSVDSVLTSPFWSAEQPVDASGDSASSAEDEVGWQDAERRDTVEREYTMLLDAVLADGLVHPKERAMLTEYATEWGVSDAQHVRLLELAGWSEDEYRQGAQRHVASLDRSNLTS